MARRCLAALALGFALTAGGAQASTLIGSTAEISVTGPTTIVGPSSATIGGGAEFLVDASLPLVIDIGADTVLILNGDLFGGYGTTALRSITLTGLVFTAPAATISGFSLVTAGVDGISAANVTVGPSSLTFSIDTSFWDPSGNLLVTLQTTPANAVPLPGAMALLAPALLGLGLLGRRA